MEATTHESDRNIIHVFRNAEGEHPGQWVAVRDDGAVLGVEDTLGVFREAFGTLRAGYEATQGPAAVPRPTSGAMTDDGNASVYWTALEAWATPTPDPAHNDAPIAPTGSALDLIDWRAASEFGVDAPGGIYEGVSKAQYLNHPALSRSVIAEAARQSIYHARHKWKKPSDADEATVAMQLGTATHTKILEPALFDDAYDVAPETCSSSFKSGKDCTYAAKHRVGGTWYCGRHVPDGERDDIYTLSAEDMQRIDGMETALRANEEGRLLLFEQDGINELTVLWTDEETGLPCKARIDRVVDVTTQGRPQVMLIDLKTASSAHPEDLRRSIAKFGYWAQPSFYGMGLEQHTGIAMTDFAFAVVESTPPHTVAWYRLGSWTAAAARNRVYELLAEIAEARETGDWPGFQEGIQPIGMKRYERDRLGIVTERS